MLMVQLVLVVLAVVQEIQAQLVAQVIPVQMVLQDQVVQLVLLVTQEQPGR